MKIADESLGQCEARHWGLGRCHLIPHGPEVNHWIENKWTPGLGITFTDSACQGSAIVCEDMNRRAVSGEAGA